MKINDILNKYTTGEMTLPEANDALAKETDGKLKLDPERNVIREDERDRFGLLDTGTGSLDKVEIDPETMQLKHDNMGDMDAMCIFGGKTYAVNGCKLTEA